MGVLHDYFVLEDDEQAAALLDSYDQGILGAEAATELVSLEAPLLGSSPHWPATKELMDRPDHAVVIAADADEPANVNALVSRIAEHTTALIANATPKQLSAAMGPRSQTEEYAGHVAAAELAEMMEQVLPLFRQAVAQCQCVYVRTRC
jgi:ribosomal protein L7Ae-like RNA K-turn-binding protein